MGKRKMLSLASATICLALLTKAKKNQPKKKRRKRKYWTKPFFQKRSETTGYYGELHTNLRKQDPEWLQGFVRMREEDFEFLVERITPFIKKSDTRLRKAISVGERLAVTLKYLATGESFAGLANLFYIGKSTISEIIAETCKAIYDCLKDDCFKTPSTKEEWIEITKQFKENWGFPNCCGALDGKCVKINPPHPTLNVQLDDCMIWLAIVDAQYKFKYVDIEAYNTACDIDAFTICSLSTALKQNTLNFPDSQRIPDFNIQLPYVVVADEAFPSTPNILNPYSQLDLNSTNEIFNYKLLEINNVAENAFGICTARFRILQRCIDVKVTLAKNIILAICTLHNFLISRESGYATSTNFDCNVDGELERGDWRFEIDDTHILPSVTSRNNIEKPTIKALNVRQMFAQYLKELTERPPSDANFY